jgi:hypothetical protein
MIFCCRSGSKSLDGARLGKPKFTVAPACDRPLSQQGKIITVRKLTEVLPKSTRVRPKISGLSR